MDPVTIIVGGGLAALGIAAATSDDTKTSKGIQPAPSARVTVASIQATRGRVKTAAIGVAGLPQTITIANPTQKAELQRVLEAKLKAEYDKLDSAAKKAGAAILNRELGTSLKGDESWEKVAAVAGAAAGAYAGGAVGMAIAGPIGGVAGKYLGAIAGAYVGEKAYDLLDSAWSDVEDFASDAWDWATSIF